MATYQGRKKVLWLEEWIDGATIQNDEGIANGFAWNLYDYALKLLSALVPLALESSSTASAKEIRSLKECLGKLFLWGDGFRCGRLEIVLRASDDLKETIIALLIAVSGVLKSKLVPTYRVVAVPRTCEEIRELAGELDILLDKARTVVESDDESDGPSVTETNDNEHAEAISSLETYISCLMDLLPSMEDTLKCTDKINLDEKASAPFEFQVSGPARTYVINVYDRFAKADSRLVERLGEANWQRHIALRQKLELQDLGFEIQEIPKSVFVPFSLFHDSGIGSSVPSQSSYAATAASHSSFASSLAEIDSTGLRVPSLPKEVLKGTPFTCDICGHRLTRIKNRIDWKRHVFADLKPYICTFSGCKDELLTFPTRKLWEEHEFSQHRIDRSWNCSECPRSFRTSEQWRNHLEDSHSIVLNDRKFQIVANRAEKRKAQPIESQQCPLCLCIPGKSKRDFVTHVGKHMERIALAAIPRENASDSESDGHSTASRQTDSNRSSPTKYICIEPVDGIDGEYQPLTPLSKCRSCIVEKRYGAYYNAAAHLRRAHFQPKLRKRGGSEVEKRSGSSGKDWPPMLELKRWMKEVKEQVDKDSQESDDEEDNSNDEEDNKNEEEDDKNEEEDDKNEEEDYNNNGEENNLGDFTWAPPAPEGWSAQWDKTSKRYYFVELSTINNQ